MIEQLVIQGFGPFTYKEINFEKGINLITGENASGKTQIIGSILFAYYGERAINKFNDSVLEESQVTVVACDSSQKFRLTRAFNKKTGLDTEISFKVKSSCNLSEQVGVTQNFIDCPVAFINGPRFDNEVDINKIVKLIETVKLNKEHKDILEEVFLSIKNKSTRSKIQLASAGEQTLVGLLSVIDKMLESDMRILLIDELEGYFHNSLFTAILELIQALSERLQVIMTTNQNESAYFGKVNNIISLGRYNRNGIHLLSYNSIFSPKNLVKNEPKQELVRFIKGNVVEEEENIENEFKEVKGANPVRSIIDCVDQYVVAFLNSHEQTIGQIMWGINDNREVIGVKLNYESRDRLRREVVNKLSQIKPHLPQNKYSVDLINVYNESLELIEELYVVIILVLPIERESLYASARDEVFIKTAGGKRKLTTQEILLEFAEILKTKNTYKD